VQECVCLCCILAAGRRNLMVNDSLIYDDNGKTHSLQEEA
jgi:hypothetical protein